MFCIKVLLLRSRSPVHKSSTHQYTSSRLIYGGLDLTGPLPTNYRSNSPMMHILDRSSFTVGSYIARPIAVFPPPNLSVTKPCSGLSGSHSTVLSMCNSWTNGNDEQTVVAPS